MIYSGVIAGELIREKLIPGHALAMSILVLDSTGKEALDYEQAIQYLRRQDIQKEFKSIGWQLVSYQEHPLGWVNVLHNRVNNYYPKELRILKAG